VNVLICAVTVMALRASRLAKMNGRLMEFIEVFLTIFWLRSFHDDFTKEKEFFPA